MTTSDERGIYMVLGMHRSGTSLLAGLLHQAGVTMGSEKTFRPRANPENPRGFFENVQFRRVNDTILGSCGYDVKSWDPRIPAITASRRQRLSMRRLLRRYGRRYPRWGWKDPRQVLTCSLWVEELDRLGLVPLTRMLLMFRSPSAVAKSMAARGNVPTVADGIALWCVYNELALDVLERWSLRPTAVSYEHILGASPDGLAAFGRSIGVDFNRQALTDFVTPGLDRSSTARMESNLPDHLRTRCDSVWSRLLHLEKASRCQSSG